MRKLLIFKNCLYSSHITSVQYCGGCSVHFGGCSVHRGITSVLWGIASVLCGIDSVLWRLFSTVGDREESVNIEELFLFLHFLW